jgi:F-box/leucine-rich repeat protein 2/20
VLTHLDLEELEALTNAVFQCLASSPCARSLLHLNVSDCAEMGDIGMLAVLQTCTGLRSPVMGNTRISDLVLTETAAMVRRRSLRTVLMDNTLLPPTTGLRLVPYDCSDVTWAGIREILSHNTELITTARTTEPASQEKTSATNVGSSSSSLARQTSPSLPSRASISFASTHIPRRSSGSGTPTLTNRH